MSFWNISLQEYDRSNERGRSALEEAEKIKEALRLNNGPLWEKDLKKKAGVRHIGCHFKYLNDRYGIVMVDDSWNKPDDNCKLYVWPGTLVGHCPKEFDPL